MSCSKHEIEASQSSKGYNTGFSRRAGRNDLLRGKVYLLGGKCIMEAAKIVSSSRQQLTSRMFY